MPDLKDIVNGLKEQAATAEAKVASDAPVNVYHAPSSTEITVPEYEDDDDDSIIVNNVVPEKEVEEEVPKKSGVDALKEKILKQDEEKQKVTAGEIAMVSGVSAITMEEIRDRIQKEINSIGVPADSADIEANSIYAVIARYRKRLFVEEGLDDVELNEAIEKRLNKEFEAVRNKYGNGGTIVINVPESSADKLEFSEAQKRKMDKAKKIQLVEVQKKELNTMKIKKFDKRETKLRFIDTFTSKYVSKYSIPLPHTGEFMTVRGALILELYDARVSDKASEYTMAEKQSSLVYKHYLGGAARTSEDNSATMSYEQFINYYRYHDLPFMVYAVACASSGPMTISQLQCQACGKTFSNEFSISSLLTMKDAPEDVLKIYNGITENHGNVAYMNNLKAEKDELIRYESPFTGITYDIGSPSIARAMNILSTEMGGDNDSVKRYISNIAMFVHAMFITEEDSDDFIQIEENEYETLLETLSKLPQNELIMLTEVINNKIYIPSFVLKTVCPECGRELVNNVPVNDFVFFVNPESETAVEVTQNPTK